MATNETLYLRKGATIRTLGPEGTYNDETYFDPNNGDKPSISAAKRASRKLQEANGGLGRGSLKVVDKFPA